MENIDKPFSYNKRYISRNDFIDKQNTLFKIRLLNSIYRNRVISKRLNFLDIFSVEKKETNNSFSYDKEFRFVQNDIEYYNKISLCEIDYFETLEIDDFDKYIDNLISKFSNDDRFFKSTRDKKDLKEKLSKVKHQFDSISWGNLFYLNFEKHREKNNDLISEATISYIKTTESYFIIRVQITPSDKFKDLYSQIISDKEVMLSKQHYHSYLNILKHRRFYSHESISLSNKKLNIDNLLGDLNYQVKLNITKYFAGYFHKNRKDDLFPSIEYYEIEDFNLFHKDISLKDIFGTGFNGHYSIDDNEIEIYFSNKSRRPIKLQVVKKRGHGKKEQSDKDITNYDKIETHYLLNSLAFPCVFRAILLELFENLNRLKRNIYDFGNDTRKVNIFKSFFFIKYNSTYLDLKQTLVQILITTKRFEKEFTKRNLILLTSEYDLNNFTPRNKKNVEENQNFLNDTVEDFGEQIKDLKSKTEDINEIFKSIEELNTYRTNYFLQIISLFIGLLAFIFTFNKVKDLVYSVFNWVMN